MTALSPQERELVERYIDEKQQASHDEHLEQDLEAQHQSRRRFTIFLSILVVVPFIVASIFIYDVSKINDTLNVSGFNQLRSSLSNKNYSILSHHAGLQPVATAASTYNHRYAIVGLIFTVFLLLIVLSTIGRIVFTHLRGTRGR